MAVFFRGEREFPVFLADQQPDGRVSQKRETVIRVGVNAADAATADRAAFLIDGKSYFERLEEVLPRAKRTIWIVGWDFNPEIRLHPGSTLQLGELLRRCVDANPDLDVRILVWAMGPIYSGKTLRFFRRMPWSDHPRITLKFDLRHPLRACHHQKLVAIDDRIAFLGGMDLTARRWDEPSHDPVNAERVSPEGKPYGPVHDIQAMVEGEAARMVADIARHRWKRATGEAHSPTENSDLAWPADFEAPLTACRTAVALTEPWTWSRKGRREAIRLTHDALMAARKTIYIETQYLASFGVARTLARRLRDPEGPEIIAIVTRSSHGFLEKIMMGNNRDRLIRRLKRADRYGRLRVLYPAIPRADGADQEIIIHSKLIIVDDRFVRIGSSNLNYRSEGLDTECDLAIEAGDAAHAAALTRLRHTLMAEHVDADPAEVARLESEGGSMVGTLDRLNVRPRGLRPFDIDVAKGETTSIPGTGLIDPKEPFWPLQTMPRQLGIVASRLFGALSLSGSRPRK